MLFWSGTLIIHKFVQLVQQDTNEATFKGYHVLKRTELLCLQLRLSNIFHYSVLQVWYNLSIFRNFSLFLLLFLKVKQKLLYRIK